MTVDEVLDFDAAEERMRQIGKTTFTPMLSSAYYDFSRDDAAWLILRRDGQDIGGVAARRDLLHSETLADFWQRSYRRIYRESGRPHSHTHASAAVSEISGVVIYTGEFFISKDARGSRNLLTFFTHYLFAYCSLRWHMDWLYGFVRAADVRKGYAAEYGFTRQVPGAQIWDDPPPGRMNGEYLVALNSSDLDHMARYYASKPHFLAGEDSLNKVEKFKT